MLKFNRVCWLDLETTGTDPNKHDIIEIAMILEKDGVEVARGEWKCKPHPGTFLSQSAAQTTGLTREIIETYPDPQRVCSEVLGFLDKHLVNYEKGCRYILAGYCISFDWEFLRTWISREFDNDDRQFWYRFYAHTICVRQTACEAGVAGNLSNNLDNLKLTTLTAALGIKHDAAHSAMSDIVATRELYRKFKGK